MSWMERFSLVMRSSFTVLRDKVEDPERLLYQLVVDMEEELTAVRRGVAEAIADEILLRKRSEHARAETEEWLQRATSALSRKDEAGARAALEQKGLAEQRAADLHAEYQKQRDQTEKLRRSVRDLEDKIRQAKQKQRLLVARLTRANSAQRINAALDRADSSSAFAEFGRLEARVERSEAMAEAYDRLDGRDPDAEELARKFADAERQEKAAQELEELKRRLQP